MGKAPLAAFDIKLLGRLDFDQVAHRAGDDVGVVLEMVVMFLELAGHGCEGTHQVLGDRGLFGDHEGFAHFQILYARGHYNLRFSRAHARMRTYSS